MKAFIAFSTLLALAVARPDQHSHQSVKHGNAPAVTTSIHKPHGGYHATVHSQRAATPDEVHQYHNEEKYVTANHAPAHVPVHGHHAPVYHAAPVHHVPVHHAPVHHAPVYHPAPVHKPAIVHPAPAYKPAHPAPAYHEPAYDGPAVYQYAYAVADDYSGANFGQNEARDGYATNGEYRVNLPDGRTQIVTYNVADGYSGYVADVKYEGEAHYAPYEPKKPAPYHA